MKQRITSEDNELIGFTEKLTWLILHMVTAGKKTSDKGAVVVSTVVTTVAFVNSEVCLKTKQQAMITELKTIPIHKILQPFEDFTYMYCQPWRLVFSQYLWNDVSVIMLPWPLLWPAMILILIYCFFSCNFSVQYF